MLRPKARRLHLLYLPPPGSPPRKTNPEKRKQLRSVLARRARRMWLTHPARTIDFSQQLLFQARGLSSRRSVTGTVQGNRRVCEDAKNRRTIDDRAAGVARLCSGRQRLRALRQDTGVHAMVAYLRLRCSPHGNYRNYPVLQKLLRRLHRLRELLPQRTARSPVAMGYLLLLGRRMPA